MLYGNETWCLMENETYSNFEKDQDSNGESNVWCKTDGEKEDRGSNGDVGLKETVVQMAKASGVRWYGHVLRRDDRHAFRKAEGQKEAWTTKQDMEDASGEGEQECWFGEGGCLESSEIESGHWRDCS